MVGRSRRGLVFLAAALLCSGCASAGRTPDAAKAAKYQKAIDRVYPALVRILVVSPVFQNGRELRMQGSGSGVIISADGLVVTNHHVAGRAASIVCVLSDKQEVRAERVGTDPLSDICVLKLPAGRAYPFARFGDSGRLQVGDTVLAMGSPGALSQSVTAGVLSNVDLVLPNFWGPLNLDGEPVGSLVKWIAHDAAIFPGNSGGPLVDLDGEVIGINELGVGLGAAIPGNLVRKVADEIVAHGEPARSWLGIGIQPLLKSSGRKTGVLVSGVIPGSPAAAAGLQPGDIILSYEGHPVSAQFAEDLPLFNRLVFASPVGAKVRMAIERGGAERTLEMTTRLREKARAEDAELKEWGMTARDLTELLAKAMRRQNADGVLVSSVRPGGPCSDAKPEIRPGDVIVAVAGRAVKNEAALEAETAAIIKGRTEPVPTLVAFERDSQQWLALVKVGIRELQDRSPEARKAWLPASFQVLTTDLADALQLKGATGVRITDVFPGRSAEKAGLRVGDIVTAVDGDRVAASRPEDDDVFPAMIRQRRVGQTVQLTVIRGGKEQALPVELERSPRATREMKQYEDVALGFTARDLSDEDRRTRQLETEVVGALITAVEPGSLAAVGMLGVGDIVLSVAGQPTPDVASIKKAAAEQAAKKEPRIVFFVRRGIQTFFVEIETPFAR